MTTLCYNYSSDNRINSRSAAINSLRPDTRKVLLMRPHFTPDASGVKTCIKCKKSKPATPEYFHRSASVGHGLKPRCKECIAEDTKAYRDSRKELISEKKRAHYTVNRSRLLEQKRAYSMALSFEKKRHVIERTRKWFEANREHVRSYREANRERSRKKTRAYWQANPEKMRAKNALRRSRKRSAEGSYTAADLQRQYKAQKGKCYYCGATLADGYHADHVVPLSRGGSNAPENIVVACPTCNTSKNNRLPHEWPEGGRLL